MELNQHQIVTSLVQNEMLVRKWQDFVGELKLKSAEIVQWEYGFNNRTITPYELFVKILDTWKLALGKDGTLDTLVGALNNIDNGYKYEVSGNTLTSTYVGGENSKQPNSDLVFYGVTPLIYNFTGRDQEISELTQALQGPLKHALVCGLGGIGKTELVKKFAHKKSTANHVTWLNGETQSILRSSIQDLAEHLGIQISSDDNKDELTILKKLSNRLHNQNWLMIIDNVEEIYETFKVVIEFTVKTSNIFAVVTSQCRSILGADAALLEIDHLLPKDAFDLVKNSITTETSAEKIESLCETLQYFPLALQQAIAYIIEQQQASILGTEFDIKEYLEEFRCQKMKVFDFQPSLTNEYKKTVLITWNLTMERLRRNNKLYYDEAVKILNILAFLDSNNLQSDFFLQIHLFFFEDSASLGWFQRLHSVLFCAPQIENKEQNKEYFEQTIQTLKNYSIIKVENNTISAHRLVQELIRFNLDENTKTRILDTILTNLDIKAVQKTDVQHILSVWKHIQKEPDLFIKHSGVSLVIYDRLNDLSLYVECLRFAENNFQLLKKKLGEEHFYTLVMERFIAAATMNAGKYEEALEQFQIILPKMQKILGKEHDATLVTANNMATTLSILERYSEALEIYYEILEVDNRKFGKDHVDTKTTKHNIAVALDNEGKYSESMKFYQEVLEWQNKKLGPNHPFTLNTRHNIATCLFEQSQYDKALIEFENILELQVKYLGEEHADTLDTKSWLANTLAVLGQKETALKIHQEILPFLISFGEDHPHTINTKSQIELLKTQ